MDESDPFRCSESNKGDARDDGVFLSLSHMVLERDDEPDTEVITAEMDRLDSVRDLEWRTMGLAGQLALTTVSAIGVLELGLPLCTLAIVDRSRSLKASMTRLPSSSNSIMACRMSLVVFKPPSSKMSSPMAFVDTFNECDNGPSFLVLCVALIGLNGGENVVELKLVFRDDNETASLWVLDEAECMDMSLLDFRDKI